MSLLGRIGIGTKVGIGAAFLIALILVVTVVSFRSLYAARDDFFEYRQLARQSNALGRLQANMMKMRLDAKEYLVSGAAEPARLLQQRADALASAITETRWLFSDLEALEALSTIENDARAFAAAFFQIVALAPPGDGAPDASASRERDRLAHEVLDRLGPKVDAAIEAMKRANLDRQDELGPRASDEIERSATAAVFVSIVAVLLGVAAASLLAAVISGPINAMTMAMGRLAAGDLNVEIPARDQRDEVGAMARAVEVFKEALQRLETQRRQRAEAADISTALQLAESPESFGNALLDRLAPRLEAGLGLFYMRDSASGRFHSAGGYACDPKSALTSSFMPGEGLPGQCVASRRTLVVADLPADSHVIGSGLAAARPNLVACIPVAAQEGILGVIEVARHGEFTQEQRELLELVIPVVGLNLGLLARNLKTAALLEQTRCQAEELRLQTEELQATEDELRLQQEELRAANDALEEKTRSLVHHAAELEAARAEAVQRAAEVASASEYKSQFLASMSHELRTPLNSILLLASALVDGAEGELSEDQRESVAMIGESGRHLLSLINDILDLSKIEAGKLELIDEDFRLADALAYVERVFVPEAAKKGVAFTVHIAPSAPVVVRTDRQRFTQVMINLVGNAVKFTDRGDVRISATLDDGLLCLSVSDTGIGIVADRLDHIFGAFQQLDGATSRRYGGTGLGLAICKSLVELMGGRIEVTSTPGVGSVFSVYLRQENVEALASASDSYPLRSAIPPLVLVVAPDPRLESLLSRLIGSLGYRSASAASAEAALASVAAEPPAGILLDLETPDGLDALRRLKADPESAVVPIFVLSADAGAAHLAKTLGAMGHVPKPMVRTEIVAALRRMVGAPAGPTGGRRVLVVEDNLTDARALEKLFRADAIDLVVARSGEEAMQRLTDGRFDAVILDLMLPDMSGFFLLEQVCAQPGEHPPFVIYSAHDLNAEDIYLLRSYAESVVTKGRAHSRLREEVLEALNGSSASEDRADPQEAADRFKGRRLLLVDDDIRNLIALSKNLRLKGFEVEVASDGAKALDLLMSREFDVMLTDIMMPDMDGYELIRRARAAYRTLPIVAATAKAMKGDAELCLQSGANDYLAKPLDLDILLSVLERWIP